MTVKYLVSRFARLIISFFIIATLVFFILKLAPGSPLSMYVNPTFTQEHAERLIHQFGLDQPMHIQYLRYLKSVATFNFGKSFRYREDVSYLLASKIPNTLVLLIPTMLLTYLVGVTWGMIAGWRRGTKFELTSVLTVLIGRAAPNFWIAMMILSVFAFGLKWFPSSGMTAPGMYYDSFWQMAFSLDFIQHMILPVITFTIYLVGLPFLVMRTGMLENINRDFVMMHRYAGLSESKVMRRAARNALLPVVTIIALGIGYVFEGAPLIETVFTWPGVGLLLVSAVTSRDYPLAQACFLLLAASVLVMNFIADLLYGLLDPRIATGRRFQ